MPLGPWELAIILLIVIIIFGVGKLPQIGGALGQGIREFRTSATGGGENEGEQAGAAPDQERADRVEVDNEAVKNERVTVVKDNEER